MTTSSSTITDRLYTIRYKCDDQTHLTIKDQKVCENCGKQPCTFVCPSDVYTWNPDQKTMQVAFENCMECGTCRIVCSSENIDWFYTKGGFGITYKYG